MLLFIYATVLFFLGVIAGYVFGKVSKEDQVSFDEIKSELSDPTINIPPVWFWRPHLQILEVLYSHDPYEVQRKVINLTLGKSAHHTYERQLWLWWMVNRREERNSFGWKTHYYTLTSKGKDALIRYNNQF
jgi:hypothetical protein